MLEWFSLPEDEEDAYEEECKRELGNGNSVAIYLKWSGNIGGS